MIKNLRSINFSNTAKIKLFIKFIIIVVIVLIINDFCNFFVISQNLLGLGTLLSTLLIALIAVNQLPILNKTACAELLARIEERYGSSEILEARKIIHEIYLKCKDQNNFCQESHVGKMKEEIKNIGNDVNKSREFILLLNFLDFLEYISYNTRKEYLSIDDMREMFGGNVPYWFKLYDSWIVYRRNKFKKKDMYCQLEWLVKKISNVE